MAKGDRDILKADPDDGTTPIANLLLEALAMAHLSGEEKGIILFIWRRTYGWEDGPERRKVWDEISLPEFAAAINTSKRYVATLLSQLDSKKVILRNCLGKGKGYKYTTNTRVAEWGRGCLNQQGLLEKYTRGLSKRYTPLLPKSATPLATNLPTLKERERNINKDRNESQELVKAWEP